MLQALRRRYFDALASIYIHAEHQAVIGSDALFARLCRVIMLTEILGMRQVDIMLKSRMVCSDPVLVRTLRFVERYEPSHWRPYQEWLTRTGRPQAKWHERLTDFWSHRELLFIKLPMLFVDYALPRRRVWADADEAAPTPAMVAA